MQHSLILRLDRCGVREDKHFGDEFAVDFWLSGEGGSGCTGGFERLVWFVEDNHAFSYVLSADTAESEGSRLTCCRGRDAYAFAFDGTDFRGGELACAIWSDEDGVAFVDDA